MKLGLSILQLFRRSSAKNLIGSQIRINIYGSEVAEVAVRNSNIIINPSTVGVFLKRFNEFFSGGRNGISASKISLELVSECQTERGNAITKIYIKCKDSART